MHSKEKEQTIPSNRMGRMQEKLQLIPKEGKNSEDQRNGKPVRKETNIQQ